MGADVRVRVRRAVVTVQVKSAVVLVLVVVTAHVQHNTRGIVVAIVSKNRSTDYWYGNPGSPIQKISNKRNKYLILKMRNC